ncbi:MAG: DNA primase [Neisseriaceae bacterium]
MIPKDFIIELLGRADIVEVIGPYVGLKKRGSSYIACCPFHQEKTPSFTVSRQKQFYYCFGCQAHGNAIGFLMEYERLDFVEAVEKLASGVGMVVPQVRADFSLQKKQVEQKQGQKLEDANQKVAQYFFAQNKHSVAREYLLARGLSREILEVYQVGYAPQENYIQILFPDPSVYPFLVAGGLALEKNQQYLPRFRERVMFPIRNLKGEVIGFGGRVVKQSEPKYLNSPETVLFDKSQCLYGIFEAKKAIAQAKKILVVEGYMDVLALAQHGLGYAVATLGTATTSSHVKQLFRFTEELYFCFDGDEAGRKAAWRALTQALSHLSDIRTIYFLFLPEGEDPDSFIRKKGKSGFETFLKQKAIPLSQYFIAHLIENRPLHYGETKAQIIQTAKPLLAQMNAAMLKLMISKQLAECLRIDTNELLTLLEEEQGRGRDATYRKLPYSQRIEVKSCSKKMLHWLLINLKLASYVRLPDYLEYDEEVHCLLALSKVVSMYPELKNAGQLAEIVKGTRFSTLITKTLTEALEEEVEMIGVDNEENFKQGLINLQKGIVQSELVELTELARRRSLEPFEEQLLIQLAKLKI